MKESGYVPPKRSCPRERFLAHEANSKPVKAEPKQPKPAESASGQQRAIATLPRVPAQTMSTVSMKSIYLRPPPTQNTPKKLAKAVPKTPELPLAAQPCDISPPLQAMPVSWAPPADSGTTPKDDDLPVLPRQPRGRKRQRHEDGFEQAPKNPCFSPIRLIDRDNDPLLSEQADADIQPFQPWHAANANPAKPTLQRVSTLGGYYDASLGGRKAVPDALDLLYQGDMRDVYYSPEKQRGRKERQIVPVTELEDLDFLDVDVDAGVGVNEADFEQWVA